MHRKSGFCICSSVTVPIFCGEISFDRAKGVDATPKRDYYWGMRRIFIITLSLSLLSIPNAAFGAPKLTDAQIVSIMKSCVKKNMNRVNKGENILDSNFMDTTMAILSDCIESKNSLLACSKNDQGVTVCAIRGRHTGFSLGAIMGSMIK